MLATCLCPARAEDRHVAGPLPQRRSGYALAGVSGWVLASATKGWCWSAALPETQGICGVVRGTILWLLRKWTAESRPLGDREPPCFGFACVASCCGSFGAAELSRCANDHWLLLILRGWPSRGCRAATFIAAWREAGFCSVLWLRCSALRLALLRLGPQGGGFSRGVGPCSVGPSTGAGRSTLGRSFGGVCGTHSGR